jgi:hypothetical protein
MTFEDNETLDQLAIEERFDELIGELLDACVLAGESFEDHYDPHWDLKECDLESIEDAIWSLNPQPW